MLGAGVSLEIDPTSVLVHAVLFFTVLAVFSRFVVNPLAKVHDARHAATDGLQEKVDAMIEQVSTIEADYQAQLAAARAEAAVIREDLRQEGIDAAAKILDAARAEASAQMESAKGELEKQTQQARGELQQLSQQYASMIADRLAGAAYVDAQPQPPQGANDNNARVVGKA